MGEPTVSAAGMRLVRLLVGNPPRTITELMEATGVTRTAVTEQLNELVAAGFVRRHTERLSGRGRPRHLFSTTDAALTWLFVSHQRLVVPAMWQAIEEVGGVKLTHKILRRVAHLLAEYYQKRVTGRTPEQRLRQLVEAFREEGGLVEVCDNDGNLVMRKRSCPFISMLDAKQNICAIDLEMMSRIIGAPVVRTACRHEGDPCCTVEIARPGQN